MPDKHRNFDTSEWDDMQKDLKKLLLDDQKKIIYHAATQTMAKLDEGTRLILPPEVRKRSQAPYWTPKQKRWWWWAMRMKATGQTNKLPPTTRHSLSGWRARLVKGKVVISGQYKRTGTMVKSLTYTVEQKENYVEGQYGTNVKYAPYVIGFDKQSKYHRGNWKSLPVILRAYSSSLSTFFLDRVYEQVKDKLNLK